MIDNKERSSTDSRPNNRLFRRDDLPSFAFAGGFLATAGLTQIAIDSYPFLAILREPPLGHAAADILVGLAGGTLAAIGTRHALSRKQR